MITKRSVVQTIKGILLVWLIFIIPGILVYFDYWGRIYTNPKNVPSSQIGVVMGAKVHDNGAPSEILQERLNAAIELYQTGAVSSLLVSGDNNNNQEASVMGQYLIDKGIPADRVSIDPSGNSTLNTCKNIGALYQIQPFQTTTIVIISQFYHLPRTLLFCEKHNVRAIGLAVNRHPKSATKLDYRVIETRMVRIFREIGLMWLYWVGIYESTTLSNWYNSLRANSN